MATEFLGVCKRCVLVLHYNNPASVFPLLLLTIVGLHRVGLRSFFFFFCHVLLCPGLSESMPSCYRKHFMHCAFFD